jgi:uncharacterized protein YkwD
MNAIFYTELREVRFSLKVASVCEIFHEQSVCAFRGARRRAVKVSGIVAIFLLAARVLRWGRMSLWMAFLMSVLAASAPDKGTNLFQLTPQQFHEIKQVKEEIQFDRVNSELLSAAVLHEANRRRAEKGLPALKHHAKAQQAAQIQAQIMQRRGSISHENPENPRFANLPKRVQSVGVNPGFAAENVATAFGLQYQSGRAFYKREQAGKAVFSYLPNGPAIRPHSYESFARALVDAWMNSPGHRDNILHKEPQYLGVSCVAATGESGMPTFYCTQVFLAPMKVKRR